MDKWASQQFSEYRQGIRHGTEYWDQFQKDIKNLIQWGHFKNFID